MTFDDNFVDVIALNVELTEERHRVNIVTNVNDVLIPDDHKFYPIVMKEVKENKKLELLAPFDEERKVRIGSILG